MMKWSVRLGQIAGTELRAHLSCLLIVLYVFSLQRALPHESDRLWQFVLISLLIVLIFCCVILHELGHALAARRFGVPVSGIMLLPIGGVTLFGRPIEIALHDFLISAAGPFVNLLLAGLGWLLVQAGSLLSTDVAGNAQATALATSVLVFGRILMVTNLFIAIFNLIPIYPLDGGRMLRAFVQLTAGRHQANRIAFVVSLPLALALVVYALRAGDLWLLLVALLLCLGAATLSRGLTWALTLGILAITDRGAYYLVRGDCERAIEWYNRLLQHHPQRGHAYLNRGAAYSADGEYRLAYADFEQAVRLLPEQSLAYYNRAVMQHLAGNLVEALRDYDRAVQLAPDMSLVYLFRGQAQRANGDAERALADYERAIALKPDAMPGYFARGALNRALGHDALAILDRNRYVSLLTGGGRRADQRAELMVPGSTDLELQLLIKGELGWALECYNAAIQQQPQCAELYQLRADAYWVNAEQERALADYSRAIELDPRRPEAYLGRSRIYLQRGMAQQAERDLQQALQVGKKLWVQHRAKRYLRQARSAELSTTRAGP